MAAGKLQVKCILVKFNLDKFGGTCKMLGGHCLFKPQNIASVLNADPWGSNAMAKKQLRHEV